ncbi:DegV family protein [Alkalibacterium sp. MB6]|uniref:DegV family protein n=1 Tax=Alkalibacterium sp. MB6 TaxID=2081965 RepID=UPI001379B1AD|nr:DegV family protein [Alkalibacterium sp. MB6]
MANILFTTESGADVPKYLVDKYPIYVAPMHVIMDEKDYPDGTIPVTDIYDYYERTNQIPSTTSTNPQEYTELFEQIKKEDPDSIIVHIGYTSRASSSFQHATIAAKDFDNIHLIDALNVSGGLGSIVLFAAQLLERQPDIALEDLIEQIKRKVPKSRFSFIPGSLDFLRAGGRVSNAAYISASLLKIKPLIELIDGKLTSTKKYRGPMKQVVEKMFRDYVSHYDLDKEVLYLLYSVGLDESVKEIMETLATEAGFTNLVWIQAGNVISTHAGPGGAGFAGLEI